MYKGREHLFGPIPGYWFAIRMPVRTLVTRPLFYSRFPRLPGTSPRPTTRVCTHKLCTGKWPGSGSAVTQGGGGGGGGVCSMHRRSTSTCTSMWTTHREHIKNEHTSEEQRAKEHCEMAFRCSASSRWRCWLDQCRFIVLNLLRLRNHQENVCFYTKFTSSTFKIHI